MEAAEIEKLVGELEIAVDRLRSLYEQYFMGIEKLEPTVPRKDVDRRIQVLRKEQIRNTAHALPLPDDPAAVQHVPDALAAHLPRDRERDVQAPPHAGRSSASATARPRRGRSAGVGSPARSRGAPSAASRRGAGRARSRVRPGRRGRCCSTPSSARGRRRSRPRSRPHRVLPRPRRVPATPCACRPPAQARRPSGARPPPYRPPRGLRRAPLPVRRSRRARSPPPPARPPAPAFALKPAPQPAAAAPAPRRAPRARTCPTTASASSTPSTWRPSEAERVDRRHHLRGRRQEPARLERQAPREARQGRRLRGRGEGRQGHPQARPQVSVSRQW